jgi:hypothetical protein
VNVKTFKNNNDENAIMQDTLNKELKASSR